MARARRECGVNTGAENHGSTPPPDDHSIIAEKKMYATANQPQPIVSYKPSPSENVLDAEGTYGQQSRLVS